MQEKEKMLFTHISSFSCDFFSEGFILRVVKTMDHMVNSLFIFIHTGYLCARMFYFLDGSIVDTFHLFTEGCDLESVSVKSSGLFFFFFFLVLFRTYWVLYDWAQEVQLTLLEKKKNTDCQCFILYIPISQLHHIYFTMHMILIGIRLIFCHLIDFTCRTSGISSDLWTDIIKVGPKLHLFDPAGQVA